VLISIALAVIVVAVGIVGLCREEWSARGGFLTNPIISSLLLLVPPFIGIDLSPEQPGLVRLAAIFGAVVALLFITSRLSRLPRLGVLKGSRYARGIVLLLCASCLTAVALSSGPQKLRRRVGSAASHGPNVILIVMDTVRADHTSLYGYERDTTPFLKEFAKHATLYTHAEAVADLTLPTHASMFTGLYPRTHGAHYDPPQKAGGRPLGEHFTTVAEILRAKGYRTLSVVANTGFLAPTMGFAQGFDVYDWRTPISMENSVRPYSHLRKTVEEIFGHFANTEDRKLPWRRAEEINHAVNRLLDQLDGSSPYFLFVNYMDSHNPYVPPRRFWSAFPCGDRSLTSKRSMGEVMESVISGRRRLTPVEQECFNSQYDGGIAYLDSQLRELVSSLKARGQFDNTLLMITSDHGEALGERNQLGHGGLSVYQEQTGIPLIVKYPGSNSPARVDSYVSQVDLLPTMLDVAQLAPRPDLAGVSLRTITERDVRAIVSVSHPHQWLVGLNPQFRRIEEALILNGEKLVVSNVGKRELYDLTTDRKEENNLYWEDSQAARTLTEILEQWHQMTPAFHPDAPLTGDHNTLERLKSLGYVQ